MFFEVINENSAISKVIKEEKLCPNKSCVLRIVSRKQGITFLLELLVMCLTEIVKKLTWPSRDFQEILARASVDFLKTPHCLVLCGSARQRRSWLLGLDGPAIVLGDSMQILIPAIQTF